MELSWVDGGGLEKMGNSGDLSFWRKWKGQGDGFSVDYPEGIYLVLTPGDLSFFFVC